MDHSDTSFWAATTEAGLGRTAGELARSGAVPVRQFGGRSLGRAGLQLGEEPPSWPVRLKGISRILGANQGFRPSACVDASLSRSFIKSARCRSQFRILLFRPRVRPQALSDAICVKTAWVSSELTGEPCQVEAALPGLKSGNRGRPVRLRASDTSADAWAKLTSE